MTFTSKLQMHNGQFVFIFVNNLLILKFIRSVFTCFNSRKCYYISDFVYVQNDLYDFLNDTENLIGNIILAKYAKSRILDNEKLKKLIIVHELKRDTIDYK